MSRNPIFKKILPEYFQAVVAGVKRFELRKDEDDIHVGDILFLCEYADGEFTGRVTARKVTYILRNAAKFGLKKGYCILSLGDVEKNNDGRM